MKRANLITPEKFIVEEVPKPEPQGDEVLVKVEYCGICGSDIHAYYGKHPFISCPVVPGHEFSGVIEKIGSGVTDSWQIGDRVIVEPSLVCEKCYNCRHGRYNICDELKVIGCQTNGAFANYIAVPAKKVIPLHPKLSFEEGAMIEPLAVGVHSIEMANLQSGQTALIIGAGTIGLMSLQAAKAKGAKVIVGDILENRLSMAKKLGADYTINSKNISLEEGLKKIVPDGVDVILECVGAPETIRIAVTIARKGTRIVVVGVVDGDVPLPVGLIQDRELELVGDLMYLRPDWDVAQQLVVEGKAQLKPLLSKVFKLDEVQEAFKYLENNKNEALKVLLHINTD